LTNTNRPDIPYHMKITIDVKLVETQRRDPVEFPRGFWVLEPVGKGKGPYKPRFLLMDDGSLYDNDSHFIQKIDPKELGLNPEDLK
jgi:hypothetical protein